MRLNAVFQELGLGRNKALDLHDFTQRKVYECFLAQNKDKKDIIVFVYRAKARFLSKEALFVDDLEQKISLKKQKKFLKILFSSAPLCSKAAEILKQKGFEYHAFM